MAEIVRKIDDAKRRVSKNNPAGINDDGGKERLYNLPVGPQETNQEADPENPEASTDDQDKDMPEIITEKPVIDAEVEEHFRLNEAVYHPKHYTHLPSGIEAIDVVEHFNANIGMALNHIIRHGFKGNPIEDLMKAQWYISREIERIKRYES